MDEEAQKWNVKMLSDAACPLLAHPIILWVENPAEPNPGFASVGVCISVKKLCQTADVVHKPDFLQGLSENKSSDEEIDGNNQEDQKQDTGWYRDCIRKDKWQYLCNQWYWPGFPHGEAHSSFDHDSYIISWVQRTHGLKMVGPVLIPSEGSPVGWLVSATTWGMYSWNFCCNAYNGQWCYTTLLYTT